MTLSFGTIVTLLIISIIGLLVGLWGVFQKAGYKGWMVLIPGYNLWIHLKILSRPWWWLLFLAIPFINIFMILMMIWKTIRLFGKTSYLYLIPGTVLFFLYLPWLGFSKTEKYVTLENLPKFHKSTIREWVDALLFAVAAAFLFRTFIFEFYKIPTSSMESSLMVGDYLAVDKFSFGGRVPETILAIPFVHHTLPFTTSTKSYLEWVKLPYLRFKVLNPVDHHDVVVFNYPDGDSVAVERQNESYYAIVREFEAILNHNAPDYEMQSVLRRYSKDFIFQLRSKYPGAYYPGKGKEVVGKEYQVIARPVDKRENYVKRCIGLPGDTLQIFDTKVFINHKETLLPSRGQFSYIFSGADIPKSKRKALEINEEDHYQIAPNAYLYHLNQSQVEKIEKMDRQIIMNMDKAGDFDYSVFPHDPRYQWNKDNFGPLVVPAKGVTVLLNDSTVVLYKTVITHYENNKLEIKEGEIYINGEKTDQYTFKMDYYFMMGDNRHNSLDSRFWGFVPADHIVGKASFVWLSINKFKDFSEGNIRWNRMFKMIK